jgi:hypothetical protein
MRDRWNSLDKVIVDELCRAENVAAAHVYRSYRVSPLSIVESVVRLSGYGLVEFDGHSIKRTRNFLERVIYLRHEIYHRPTPWKQVKD